MSKNKPAAQDCHDRKILLHQSVKKKKLVKDDQPWLTDATEKYL